MSLLDKEPVKRVNDFLNKFNSDLSIIALDTSAKTALEAATSLSCDVGAIIKSLIFRTDKNFLLCLVAGDKRASLIKIKKILNIKDVSMASANEVKNVTGYSIGGVSPIGYYDKINIFIDNSLKRFTSVFAAAGHPNCVFKISFDDLKKITNGSIEDIIEWNNRNY